MFADTVSPEPELGATCVLPVIERFKPIISTKEMNQIFID